MIADGQVDIAGCVDVTQIREVIHQWEANGNVSWKLPLLERVMAGPFTGKESTPYGAGTVHDFMHAKVAVCDDTVFVGSFNLSRSGEKNAENVLEIEDAAIAERLAGYVDEVRARYPAVTIGCQCTRSSFALCRSLKPRARRRVLAGLADQREPDRDDVLGQADQLVEDPLLVGVADERAREALVDRGEQHEHHQRSRVDEPVGHGPRDLDAARRGELVGLVVAGVVERLVRGDHEQDRRVGDVVAAVARVVLVAERARRSRSASLRR